MFVLVGLGGYRFLVGACCSGLVLVGFLVPFMFLLGPSASQHMRQFAERLAELKKKRRYRDLEERFVVPLPSESGP